MTLIQKWLDRQPKFPGEDVPFVCMRCGDAISADAVGFVDKLGLPVHIKCSNYSGELQEYKDANNGNGYTLNPDLFPAWSEQNRLTI